MPKPTKKQSELKKQFENLHDELHTGKKIEYAYRPQSAGENIGMYLFGDAGWTLTLKPDGTYSLE